MMTVIAVGEYEVEPGVVFNSGAWRATVTVRAKQPTGPVSEVGYAFAEGYLSDEAAMKAAQRYALIASLHPEQRLAIANSEFALQ